MPDSPTPATNAPGDTAFSLLSTGRTAGSRAIQHEACLLRGVCEVVHHPSPVVGRHMAVSFEVRTKLIHCFDTGGSELFEYRVLNEAIVLWMQK